MAAILGVKEQPLVCRHMVMSQYSEYRIQEYSELGTAEQKQLYFGVMFCLVLYSVCSSCFWKHLKLACKNVVVPSSFPRYTFEGPAIPLLHEIILKGSNKIQREIEAHSYKTRYFQSYWNPSQARSCFSSKQIIQHLLILATEHSWSNWHHDFYLG